MMLFADSLSLVDVIDDIGYFHNNLTTLAYAQDMIQQVLLYCIYEERQIFEEKCDRCYPGFESDHLSQWPLRMFQDIGLGLPMRWEGESLILHGFGNFTFAVRDLDGPSSHLIVIEVTVWATRFHEMYPPGNLLGSMGMRLFILNICCFVAGGGGHEMIAC